MARQLIGTVVSDKMNKTVSVSVQSQHTHRLYHKAYSTTKKYLAHNPEDKARAGDRVQLVETKPISRRKCWLVQEILQTYEGEFKSPKPSGGKVQPQSVKSKPGITSEKKSVEAQEPK